MHRSRSLWAVLAPLVLGLVCSLAAPKVARADDVKVHLEALALDKLPMLKAYVTIVDGEGKAVRAKSGYKLMLDQQEQKDVEVQFLPFIEAKEPVDVVVVVQLSPVMEPALKNIRDGIKALAKVMAKNHVESRLALIGYGSEVKRLEEFGRPNEIARDLDKLVIDQEASEVRMIEALRVAIDLSRERAERRHRVLLFSDGIDANSGKDAQSDVGRRAQAANVIIDSLGYAPFEPGRLKSIIEISRLSSGTARRCKSTEDISANFAQFTDALFGAGIVTFGLTTSGDNNQHAVQVSFKAGRDEVQSETISVQLPPFEPADPAGRGWLFWVAVIGGGLLGLLVLLFIIGKIMGG